MKKLQRYWSFISKKFKTVISKQKLLHEQIWLFKLEVLIFFIYNTNDFVFGCEIWVNVSSILNDAQMKTRHIKKDVNSLLYLK